jgi:hypothetical protein
MENRIKKLIYEILFVDEIVEIFEEPDEWTGLTVRVLSLAVQTVVVFGETYGNVMK